MLAIMWRGPASRPKCGGFAFTRREECRQLRNYIGTPDLPMPQQANQPLPAGYVLNGYRIEKPLSSGGFGIVYLAEDDSGTPVAIKEYLPSSLPLRTEGVVVQVTDEATSRSSASASRASSKKAARWRRSRTRASSRAELLPRERNRLHGDEATCRAHPAGLSSATARRVSRETFIRRSSSTCCTACATCIAQDAAPGHQAGEHLHHERRTRRCCSTSAPRAKC